MTQRQVLYVQAFHGMIVIAAITAVTLLGLKGTLDGQSVVAVLGAAIGFAGASASSLGAVGQAVNGKATVPMDMFAEREATIRTALATSAATPAHTVEPTAVEPEPEEH